MAKPLRGKHSELWIGLAKVIPSNSSSDILGDAEGAYTNAIGLAVNKAKFRLQVKEALAELGLLLIRRENSERLEDRSAKYVIDQELKKVATKARVSNRIMFGTFHAF
jgi:hypothetical protein